jgi:UDP-2,4-diacetamido-2,4,6-trideoxy-beta-L-altropyranose hydrolase
MQRSRKILFLADAGPVVGGGHVMRCLTLAGVLQDLGASCAFMAPPAVAAVVKAFAKPGVELIPCAAETMVEAACSVSSDAVVVDHYGLQSSDETRLRASRLLIALDDAPGRPHDCDLLVDSAIDRQAADYEPWVPKASQIWTGPNFALVRPEFAAARRKVLERRDRDGDVRSILVSLGLTDVGGITADVVEAILSTGIEARLLAVVGSAAPSLPRLRELSAIHANLRVEVDVRAMAPVVGEADLAIGAGGSSTWERCCLGLPGITLVLADNQADMAARLETHGVTKTLDVRLPGFADRLTAVLNDLVNDSAARRSMSAKASLLCDGLGAERTARKILGL